MVVQQPMVSKKEQTLAVRHGWAATHGGCNRSTPLAIRSGWTATHGFNEGKTQAVFITEQYLAVRQSVVGAREKVSVCVGRERV